MHVISIVSGVPNNSLTTRITLQESLEEESRKDTPAFGEEDLEIIHRSGTEAGLLGIYNFPGAEFPALKCRSIKNFRH